MAIIYLVSVVTLWTGILLIRKNEGKQNFFVWLFLSAILMMSVQAFFGGVLNKLGIELTLLTMSAGNLIVAAICFLQITRNGKQPYIITFADAVSVFVIIGIILLFAFLRYRVKLDRINFVSVDATAHARWAMEVALEHRLPVNLYFTCLNTGMMMQVYQALTGVSRFDLYRVFIWCEVFYTALAALLFWGLIRQRCGDGRWMRFLPLLLAPFYWAGYPVYSTLFGFSYLGVAICLILALLTLLDQYDHDRIHQILFITGMNLVLYGVFVCYTLFVPGVFFGVFATLAWRMKKNSDRKLINKENIMMMLKVFLIPTILGLLYSFTNVEELRAGGGIQNEGGCYSDIYSNFILLIPFIAIGIYFLVSRKEGGYLLPMVSVHLVMMTVMLAGLVTGKISVYYYSKLNSVLWLLSWTLTAEAILGMMQHCKWAILFPFFFYGIVFAGKYGDAWLKRANPLAGRVETWNFCEIIMFNNTFFNSRAAIIPDEMMELNRYVAEHHEPGETAGVFNETQSGWFRTLTGQKDTFAYTNYKDFLKEVDEKDFHYICTGYSGMYKAYEEYLNYQDVMIENSEGKLLRVTVKPSEMQSVKQSP